MAKNLNTEDLDGRNKSENTDTTDGDSQPTDSEGFGTYTPPALTTSTNTTSSSNVKREENPFSFKHFLKRDSSTNPPPPSSTQTSTTINHSLSSNCFSNLNNGTSDANDCGTTSSPSKSATSNNISSMQNSTGARPKIQKQFQSVNQLAMESKMKRSPRFPSFDSQSSLSELGGPGNVAGSGGGHTGDDKWSMTNLLHSQSNSSFNADFVSDPTVQRSYSTYDIELSPKFDHHQQPVPPSMGHQRRSVHNNSPTTNSSSRDDSLTSNSGSLNRLGTAEFSAALPDFVQDHLVMEQWYTMSGNGSGSPSSVDFDQLPDFAVNNLETDFNARDRSSRQNDIPFDILTFSNSTASHQRSRTPVRSPTIMPLDLPDNSLTSGGRYGRRSDIQPDITTTEYHYHHPNLDAGGREEKILPDFLSDGPARLNNNNNSGGGGSGQDHMPLFNSPDDHQGGGSRLTHENSRLRDELDDCRRIMADQARQIHELETRLAESRSQESQYSATLLEQMEENLDRSNKRATAAQTAVSTLKGQVKQLMSEVEALRRENETLKEEEAGGAVGGAAGSNPRLSSGAATRLPPQAAQLSQELRLAAASAENNLRQLLHGVDNLRIMAATLESLNTVNVPAANQPNLGGATIISENDFLSDSDENDFTGPAL